MWLLFIVTCANDTLTNTKTTISVGTVCLYVHKCCTSREVAMLQNDTFCVQK